MKSIAFALVVAFCILFVLEIVIQVYFKDIRIRKNITNYDFVSGSYYYELEGSKDEVVNAFWVKKIGAVPCKWSDVEKRRNCLDCSVDIAFTS